MFGKVQAWMVQSCALICVMAVSPALALNRGDIIVADGLPSALYKIDPVTGSSTLISSGGHLYAARGIAQDRDGSIIVVNDWNNPNQRGNLVRINPNTGAQTLLFLGTDADDPWWPVARDNGDILFTDYGNATSLGGRLRRYSAAGGGSGGTIVRGGLFRQTLAMTADGNTLYIIDHSGFASPISPRILRFDLTTNAQSIVTDGGSLIQPYGIVHDPTSGMLYVADRPLGTTGGGIYRVDPLTGQQTLVTTGGLLQQPFALTFDLSGQLLVTDSRGNQPSVVVRVDPLTGAQTLVTSIPVGQNLTGIIVVPEPRAIGALGLLCVAMFRHRQPTQLLAN